MTQDRAHVSPAAVLRVLHLRSRIWPGDVARYREAPLVVTLLPGLHQRLPDLPSELIAEYVGTFLAMLEVPADLTGAWQAVPVLRVLIRELLQPHPPHPPTVPEPVLEALAAELRAHPEFVRFQRMPDGRTSWALALNVSAWEASRARGPAPGRLYELWGPSLHLGLRAQKRLQAYTRFEDQTFEDYLESVRLFFRTFPYESLEPTAVRTDATWAYHLDLFREGYLRSDAVPRPSQRMAEIHVRRLRAIRAGKPIRAHPHASPTERHEVELIDDAPVSTTDEPLRIVSVAVDSADASLDDDPEPLIDEWIEPPGEAILRTPPRLVPRLAHRFLMTNFPLWFGATSLPLGRLGKLYQAADRLFNAGDVYATGAALFLLLLLLTGRTPDELARTVVEKYDPQPGRRLPRGFLYFEPFPACFFGHAHELKSRPSLRPTSTFWLPATAWIAFPLPPFLTELMSEYVRQRFRELGDLPFLFPFLVAPEGLDLRALRTVLAAAGLRLETLPAPHHSARAFTGLLEHGFGLDRVTAALVSGRGSLRSHVQTHYTRIPLAELFNRYARATVALHEWIRGSLPATGWWATPVPPYGPPAWAFEHAVGSPLVPAREALAAVVGALIAQIRRTRLCLDRQTLVAHHNAFTAYAYLALLCLGLRPRQDPQLKRRAFLADIHWLPVSDKQSRQYIESRLTPLPKVARLIVTELARGVDRLRRRLVQLVGPRAAETVPPALLFFLDATGQPRPFDLRGFRLTLADAGVKLDPNDPLNFARHLHRSDFTQAGCHDDLTDALLGHQRAGREPLALHAVTLYGSALALLEHFLDRLLADLGFLPVPYCPIP